MASTESNHFTTMDFTLLIGSLAISALTGIYFAYQEKKKHSGVDSYFHGNRRSSPIVVGLSLTLTFVSGMTTIGYPVELYLYGTVWFWLLPCFPIVVAITSIYFIPTFHNLKLNCVYEYLEIRFCKSARLISSALVTLNLLFYMSVTICYPALSLVALTPITLHWSIALTCAICTFYTAIGGFLSVIWTDAFQAIIMFAGSVAVCIKTTMVVGGPNAVYEALDIGNRTTLFDFDTDITKRVTVWSVLTGNTMAWFVLMATNQADVQRYLSCSSIKEARKSVIIGMIPQVLITFFGVATGAAAYAYFEGCDPVLNKEIQQNDQLIPLLVAKITKGVPGLSGLFVATIYAGTLSSVSSGINSVSLIIMDDFVGYKWKNIGEMKKLRLCKLCGVAIGIVLFVTSTCISVIKGTLVTIAYTLISSFSPPVTGMFTLGMFFPWTNSIGALIGAMAGFVSVAWLSIGSLFFNDKSLQQLPRSVAECNNFTDSYTNQNLALSNLTQAASTEKGLYNISYLYFRFIGYIVTIVIGLIASCLFGKNDPKKMNPRLFVPLVTSKIFPHQMLEFFRFGVPRIKKHTNKELMEGLVSNVNVL